MELSEIMRLIWQGLINLPQDAPEREETIGAFGALESRLGYTPPELLLVLRPDGYTDVKFVGEEPEVLRLGEEMIEVPLGRPFPKTFGDWVDLAEAIKEKDQSLSPDVNENLGYIFTEDPAQSEDAKRWLVGKAGELGIM